MRGFLVGTIPVRRRKPLLVILFSTGVVMQNKTLYLSLLLIMISLTGLVPGCSKESSMEPQPEYYLAAKSTTLSVRQYADHHNREVNRLLELDRHSGCLKRHLVKEFPNLVQGMDRRNPDMAGGRDQFLRSRLLLPTLIRLHQRGHRPLEIFSLLQRCRNDFSRRQNVHPEILVGLDSAVQFLLARDTAQLSSSLYDLKQLTDRVGSAEEKCVVGVLVGSFERSQQNRTEEWYWPWIIFYDFIGSLQGGGNISAIFSAWAELMLRDFPCPVYP